MTHLLNFLIGLVSSILGAFIFLRIVLYRYRPRVKISPFIVKGLDFDNENLCYYFKIVNQSTYPLFDVEIELYQLHRIPIGDGKFDTHTEQLKLVKSYILEVPGNKYSKTDPHSLHAISVRSRDDIASILNDPDKAIQIQVMARHGLSGLVKVEPKEFGQINILKYNGFVPGDSLDAT